MNILLATWFWEFLGRLHPMIIHFPIGILVVAWGLDLFSLQKKGPTKTSLKIWIFIGALSALLSAVLGTLLFQYGSYSGKIIEQHLWGGWITAGLALFTALSYSTRWQVPRNASFLLLSLCVISLSFTGHWGASITHGANYLTEVFPRTSEGETHVSAEKLALFTAYSQQDSFPPDQLDQLNLEVRAIFAHNCYQCHSTEKQKGGLVLDHREGVFLGGDSGPIVIPGHARQSEIIRRLHLPRNDEESMPPKGKVLAAHEIDLVALWIDQGAHWADEALKVFPEAEMALVEPPLPVGSPQIDHPIDKFVDRYFQLKEITWPEQVDDRKLIRRIYLDVIGLLPEPNAVEIFVKSKDPLKREKLVDSLLAQSDAYAQHALTFWNDLLRNDYSGTGYITGGRKQISSWLYNSLLDNKPYNLMLRELVNPKSEAEGFIKGIQWRGVVNSSQTTSMQAAQNISQSLLGLNMKCASCHNSFVNNLSLDQSYAFANVFSDTTLEIFRCDKPTGRKAESGFIYPELGEITGEDKASRLEELASLMSSPKNGRVYRTIVNRYWNLLLGRGIVAPVDDMDKKPWDQDLLDWLTADFMEANYNIHHLLRTILTSNTYALQSHSYPSPTYLMSESFEFRGPTLRRLTAEQFSDAVSQIVYPVYTTVAFDPSAYPSNAEWIWHPEIEVDRHVLPKPGLRFFRKSFSLPQEEQLVSAQLLLSVDDHFTCFLNGQKIAFGDNWKEVHSLDLIESLQPGPNILAIEGKNEGLIPNPAGILLSLELIFESGRKEFILSDRTWKSTDSISSSEWTLLDFSEQEWVEVRRYGRFKKSFWGQPLAFRHESANHKVPNYARASLVQLDPFQKALGRPTRENVTTSRSDEASLLQTLTLSNDDDFHEVIALGANKWRKTYTNDPHQLIDLLYLKALGRLPSKTEKSLLLDRFQEDSSEATFEDLLWTLILLPEFQFIQ